MDRRNLGTGYKRQRYDIGQAQKAAVPQIGEQFISRGIYDSGLRKKALAQQLAAFDRARSEAATSQNRAILDLALSAHHAANVCPAPRSVRSLSGPVPKVPSESFHFK